MDLSCVGRASLAICLPVLSACGVQACPLPTSLFSTHTGGFGDVVRADESDFCTKALAHYRREGIAFDAVYVGYLVGQAQFRLAQAAFSQYPHALKIVDPAMGDHGRLYTGMDESTVQGMRALCERADLITPNATESALLCGRDAAAEPDDTQLHADLETLVSPRRAVLITSAPARGGTGILGGEAGDASWRVPVHEVPGHYPGTGDLFTSAVVGLVLRGAPLKAAAERAAAFVAAAAEATHAARAEVRHGLHFEPFLGMLAP